MINPPNGRVSPPAVTGELTFLNHTFKRRTFTFFLCLAFRWLLLSLLLIWSVNLKDPHFLPIRVVETACLMLITVAGLTIYQHRIHGFEQLIGKTVLTATLVLTLLGECSFQYRRYEVLNYIPEITSQIGQHFIIGYKDMSEIEALVSKGLIGGIFITQRNAANKTVKALSEEISALQLLRKQVGRAPLIVMTDQEGGLVSRLSPPLPQMPPLASLLKAKLPLTEVIRKAEAYGLAQGRDLAKIGVTVNLSPVVDLKLSNPENAFDFHSLIKQRAISSDPELTTRVAQAYVNGLESAGVLATLKHFPGLGKVTDDTHHFSAELNAPVTDLEDLDWLPFKKIPANSRALIMLSHVALTAIDTIYPVSFSDKVIQSIVRRKLGFKGILITDDLTMAAAYNQGICTATVKALNAGVNLLLVSYDYEKFFDFAYCAVDAYRKGHLNMQPIDKED